MKKTTVISVFVILAVLFVGYLYLYPRIGIESANREFQYMNTVFKQDQVTTVDIDMKDSDFQKMIANASEEEIFEADVTINGTTVSDIGIRTKGNLSLRSVVQMEDSDRYSFKLDFDYYDSTKSLDGLKKLNLNNNYSDASQMREYMSYKLMEHLGIATPGYSYMYVSINGEERGLYLGVEAIEETFLARNFVKGSDSLYKPDGTGSDLQYISEDFEDYSGIGAKTSISKQDEDEFVEFIRTINEKNSDLSSVMDINEMLRYFAGNTALVNLDSYQGNMKHNYYLYEENGIFSILPWDYNMSFGGFGAGGGPGGAQGKATENSSSPSTNPTTIKDNSPQDANDSNSKNTGKQQGIGQIGMGMMGGNAVSEENINFSIYTPVSSVTMEERPLVNALMSDEENVSIYEEYLSDIATTFLATDAFTAMVDEVYTMIKPYVEKDPTAFYTVDEFEEDVYGESGIIEFASQRNDSILAQLSGELIVENNTSSLGKDKQSLDADQAPEGFEMPEGMQPPDDGQAPVGFEMPEGMPPPDGQQMRDSDKRPEFGAGENLEIQPTGYSKAMLLTSAAGIIMILLLTLAVSRFKRR